MGIGHCRQTAPDLYQYEYNHSHEHVGAENAPLFRDRHFIYA